MPARITHQAAPSRARGWRARHVRGENVAVEPSARERATDVEAEAMRVVFRRRERDELVTRSKLRSVGLGHERAEPHAIALRLGVGGDRRLAVPFERDQNAALGATHAAVFRSCIAARIARVGASSVRHSIPSAPCPTAGRDTSGASTSVARASSPRRTSPARARTIASNSPASTLRRRVSTFAAEPVADSRSGRAARSATTDASCSSRPAPPSAATRARRASARPARRAHLPAPARTRSRAHRE